MQPLNEFRYIKTFRYLPKIYILSSGHTTVMQLQKQLSRTLGRKKYSRYTIVIPPKTVKELGWKKGDRLDPKIKNGDLVIMKTSGANRREPGISS